MPRCAKEKSKDAKPMLTWKRVGLHPRPPGKAKNVPAPPPNSDARNKSIKSKTGAKLQGKFAARIRRTCKSAPGGPRNHDNELQTKRNVRNVCSRSQQQSPKNRVKTALPIPQIQMDALNCPNHTSTEYWDNWAGNWTGEIISSIDDDLNGVILRAICKYCVRGPSTLTLDFGCGVGLYLPALAEASEAVLGLDISRKLIALARQSCEKHGITNVRLKRADLATCDTGKMNMVNIATFAVCANVLISPEPVTRRSILNNLSAAIKPGGYLLLVVPASKSARLIEKAHGIWLAERKRLKLKTNKVDERPETSTAGDAKRGIYRRDDVRTKHFREKEICKQLTEVNLSVVEVNRVEYAWLTEFDPPVDILDECFDEKPFDWLIIARKALSEAT